MLQLATRSVALVDGRFFLTDSCSLPGISPNLSGSIHSADVTLRDSSFIVLRVGLNGHLWLLIPFTNDLRFGPRHYKYNPPIKPNVPAHCVGCAGGGMQRPGAGLAPGDGAARQGAGSQAAPHDRRGGLLWRGLPTGCWKPDKLGAGREIPPRHVRRA